MMYTQRAGKFSHHIRSLVCCNECAAKLIISISRITRIQTYKYTLKTRSKTLSSYDQQRGKKPSNRFRAKTIFSKTSAGVSAKRNSTRYSFGVHFIKKVVQTFLFLPLCGVIFHINFLIWLHAAWRREFIDWVRGELRGMEKICEFLITSIAPAIDTL